MNTDLWPGKFCAWKRCHPMLWKPQNQGTWSPKHTATSSRPAWRLGPSRCTPGRQAWSWSGSFFFDLPGNGDVNTAQDIRGCRGASQDRQSPVRVMASWRQGYFEAVCSDAELATSLRAGLEGFSKIASHFALKMKLQPSIASQPVLPSWRSPAQHSLSGSLALQPQPL